MNSCTGGHAEIFSALFYFRDPADTVAGGELELYRWRREPRFIRHRTLERDVAQVETVPYEAKAHFAFVNSERAVHGVSPRDVTAIPRRYINFIAALPIKAFTQVNPLQRLFLDRRAAGRAGEDRY